MNNQMIQYKQAFDQYLADHAFASQEPHKLYQPIDYIMNLGGKRIRPIASLMACDLFSGDYEKHFLFHMHLRYFIISRLSMTILWINPFYAVAKIQSTKMG